MVVRLNEYQQPIGNALPDWQARSLPVANLLLAAIAGSNALMLNAMPPISMTRIRTLMIYVIGPTSLMAHLTRLRLIASI